MRSIKEVETRLRSLPASVELRPADDRALGEIHLKPRPDSPRRARPLAIKVAGGVAAAVTAILLINIIAAYLAPKYERVLADSGVGAISQRLLSAVGLKAGDITAVGDSATSSGHTLKLVGAYADGLRTVLFIEIDGRGVGGNPSSTDCIQETGASTTTTCPSPISSAIPTAEPELVARLTCSSSRSPGLPQRLVAG